MLATLTTITVATPSELVPVPQVPRLEFRTMSSKSWGGGVLFVGLVIYALNRTLSPPPNIKCLPSLLPTLLNPLGGSHSFVSRLGILIHPQVNLYFLSIIMLYIYFYLLSSLVRACTPRQTCVTYIQCPRAFS